MMSERDMNTLLQRLGGGGRGAGRCGKEGLSPLSPAAKQAATFQAQSAHLPV